MYTNGICWSTFCLFPLNHTVKMHCYHSFNWTQLSKSMVGDILNWGSVKVIRVIYLCCYFTFDEVEEDEIVN